ncbi:MAG: hypothetical protein NVSMB6_09790 [Burkholderiaceae bacterium]
MVTAAPIAWGGTVFGYIAPATISEGWLTTGFYTLHFQRGKGLNGKNFGLGGEYRFSTVASVTAGRFFNSNERFSDYVGLYYQPISAGPFRVGAVVGGFNGYLKTKSGGWFPAAIPVASYDVLPIGIDVAVIPSYKDRLYGGVSFQLKIKFGG